MPAYGSLRGSGKVAVHYSPDQPRGEAGKWTASGVARAKTLDIIAATKGRGAHKTMTRDEAAGAVRSARKSRLAVTGRAGMSRMTSSWAKKMLKENESRIQVSPKDFYRSMKRQGVTR